MDECNFTVRPLAVSANDSASVPGLPLNARVLGVGWIMQIAIFSANKGSQLALFVLQLCIVGTLTTDSVHSPLHSLLTAPTHQQPGWHWRTTKPPSLVLLPRSTPTHLELQLLFRTATDGARKDLLISNGALTLTFFSLAFVTAVRPFLSIFHTR